ncbi:Protein O-mannosyltransferase 2 [Mortierella antarctica]|nr:Protein O-mannosyltransferase 2 [Mortierella antarctica]
MYSNDIKRRNPAGPDGTRSHFSGEQHGNRVELEDEYRPDPYAPNPLKTAFQHQQQNHPYYPQHNYREHPSLRAPRREYSSNKYIRFYQENDSVVIPVFLTLLAFWTRFRDIKSSNIVVWDEAHFGKFGSYYIKGDFYFDVHPPLGKMLVGLSGALAGYDGSFGFESGAAYPAMNYGFMRIFNAFFGAIMVPFAYWTAQELQMSRTACIFAATLVLFDNAYLTISRFILLDSMLLAATCFVLFCLTRFRNERHDGPGDAQMSSLFQAGLNGNDFRNNPLEVAFGSKVSVKNTGYGGGLLHSHVQTYPEGSNQQQVTCYHHKDSNNHWIVKRIQSQSQDYESVQTVRDGDVIRLVHEQTKRNLHSHRIKAPVTSAQWEVSGYGNEQVGDINDEWIVEVVDEHSSHPKNGILRSLTTSFRLRHNVLGCLLTAENVNLPQWGFRQIEVTCDQRNRTASSHSIWNVEQHWNEKLPAGGEAEYRSKFWRDFWHLNVAMMTSNNALIPDPDKEDVLASNPSQWPFLAVGLRMCGWGDDLVKFYLLGNPIVWWGSTLSLLGFGLMLCFYIVRRQRKFQDISPLEWDQFQYVGKILVGGWFLHYMPFCVMGRVTYLHHYFPALYFSLLLFSFMLDHFVHRPRISPQIRALVWAVAFGAVTLTFIWFWHTSYGIHGPAADTMRSRQWRKGWNIIDDHKPSATF